MTEHVNDRSADQQAQRPSEVDLERIRGASTLAAEVLEGPAAIDRLQIALLLSPTERVRALVGEADDRLDRLPLGVGLGLAAGRAALAVALERVHRLEPALPLR